MKIDKPFYQVRIMHNEPNGDFKTLSSNLEIDLNTACSSFLNSKHIDLLDRTKMLAIKERIALSQYMTGLKIQNFAINAANNDNIKLNEEINLFLKQYDKITKS